MDAALQPSNARLAQMLGGKLRKDRHPRHAAEVRENVVPVEISHHRAMDEGIPRATLFLHEDVLARALAYEQELQRWKIAELNAGRGDPGRPMYDEVFGGMIITQHRHHRAGAAAPFFRNESNGNIPNYQAYSSGDCPGIYNPASQKNSLSSIPSSPYRFPLSTTIHV